MRVILLERIEKLGELGDAVDVRAGYGRNYLLPYGKAIVANSFNLERFESERAERLKLNDSKRESAELLKVELHEKLVIVIRAASEAGHLYGSVTARDISVAIKVSLGLDIDRSLVVMRGSAKMLGIFDFTVRLHPEVFAIVRVNIAQSVEEAGLQADRVSRGLPALSIGDDGSGHNVKSKATAAAEAALEQASKESAEAKLEERRLAELGAEQVDSAAAGSEVEDSAAEVSAVEDSAAEDSAAEVSATEDSAGDKV